MRRALLCLLSATVVLLLAAGSAQAGAPAGCAGAGATVAVDFGHWNGPVVRGCARNQRSGFALLHAAGFSSAGDTHDGDSFICRLGDRVFRAGRQYPTPAQQACSETPGASAYWSYWLAQPGQNRWTYAPLGPLEDVPKPGEVELWEFGATTLSGVSGSGVPHLSPDRLRAADAHMIDGRVLLAAEATRVTGSSGSPAGVIVAAAIALALLGGAALATRRRRRYQ